VVEVVARLLLGAVLIGSAGMKLASPASSRAALATFGFAGGVTGWIVWSSLIVTELGLGIGVIAGVGDAAWIAAGLMLTFAAAMVGAILRGRAGAPCACFGSRSSVSWAAVARNLALAAGFVAIAIAPEPSLETDEWLAIGLGVALVACVGLAIAVLALAREIGMLRLRLGPGAALEIPEEGPELGSRSALIERFELRPETELALAVFTSEGCHVCRSLGPAVDSLEGDPVLAVARFDEVTDADAWRLAGIPGSPFGVAVGPDGTVLAKGTFNNLAQLESIVATGLRRRGALAEVAAHG
jgi:Methylamine utilisation protein MauE